MSSMIKITQTMAKEVKMVQLLDLKPNSLNQIFCDYSDAYILVTEDITKAGGDANTRFAFKNCAPFTKCITHINDERW